MARRKFKNQWIIDTDIKEEIKFISGSDNYFISENGNVYIQMDEHYFFKKKLYQNPTNLYMYCGIKYDDKIVTKRVHRLVAEAFIPMHDVKYNVVGHKDNNKSNNVVSNLYWTTTADNTKKAFDDGLAHNAKGFEDSQSYPVLVYDLQGTLIDTCGSCTEAAKKYGISKSTVCRQCKNGVKSAPTKGYYFRYLSSLTTIESIELNSKKQVE